jgi:hypothetical protein
MLNRLQRWTRRSSAGVLITLIVVAPTAAFAQEERRPSLAVSTLKGVVLDPTTFAPAVIAYDATMRDWNSSQLFFSRGYFEHNERFTISGRPNDLPVSYGDGRQRILSDAVVILEMSLANNLGSRLFERALLDRFPTHPKVVRAIGWLERSVFASYMSYRLSAAHYRQAADNERRARELGYR